MTIDVCHHKIDVDISQDAVQMLLYQPFIQFEHPQREPFRIARSQLSKHSDGIQRILECMVQVNPSFILLPEYSIPGLIGINQIHDAASHMFPNNTVLIGGVDGLSKSEYAEAIAALGDSVLVNSGNEPEYIEDGNWVNCSVTWVKDRSGIVKTWVQPKIEAAWPEENISHLKMFRGKSLNFFQAVFENSVPCRFGSLLCYDWIGRNAKGKSVPQRLLAQLNSDWAGDEKKVHWLFLLQHNAKPNHYTFTTATRDFLTDYRTYPCVDRSHTAVVCVSTAGSERPERASAYGFSSVIFAPGAPFNTNESCPPTVTSKARNLDGARDLGTCQDYVFREMGECIHRCDVRVPSFVIADPSDRKLPVTGEVFCLTKTSDDPRRPNGPVSAAVKWINDQLDVCCSPSLSDRYFGSANFKQRIISAEVDITKRYRLFNGEEAEKAIHDSTPQIHINIDDWSDVETRSLSHIHNSLSLCGSGIQLDTVTASFHACCESSGVELIAICGQSHEECRDHFETKCHHPHGPVLLISRDEENTRVSEAELKKFYDKDHGAGIKAIDYQSLLQTCQNAMNELELVAELQKMVEIDEPTII